MSNRSSARLFAACTLWLGITTLNCKAEDLSISLQQDRRGYTGSQDTWISVDPKISKRNLGGMQSFSIWQYDGVALIRFDLSGIPQNAIVKGARLELFCLSAGFSQEEEITRSWPVGVFACTHEWKEGTGVDKPAPLPPKPRRPTRSRERKEVSSPPRGKITKDGATVDTYDGKQPWPGGKVTSIAGELLGTATLQGPEQRWYAWDLNPKVVQDWIAGRRPNYGLWIWGKPPGKSVAFVSRESPQRDQRPILHLNISVPATDVEKLRKLLTPEWKPVAKWTGHGIKETEIFSVASQEWRINLVNKKEDYPGLGNVSVWVYDEHKNYVSIATRESQGSDTSYIRSGPGRYYLKVISANVEWEITVEDQR